MASLSKLLDQGLRNAKCTDVYHPGRSCAQFQFGNTFSNLFTCLKFFLPIPCIPLLLKGRNIRKKDVWNAITFYSELITVGFLVSQTIPMALCGTRAVYGKISKKSFMFIPMMIPSMATFLTSKRVSRIFAASLFQVTLEASLRNGRNPLARTIFNSKPLQTLIFMMCSAFIINSIQTKQIRLFWILKANIYSKDKINKPCTHGGSCFEFILHGILQNLLIGILVDLLNTLLVGVPRQGSLKNDLLKKLHSLNFSAALFLASYNGIYRASSCVLNHTNLKFNPKTKDTGSAFLSGVSYYFLPRLTMLCYVISVSIEIAWKLFKRKQFKKNLQILEELKKIPLNKMYVVFAGGYLVHMYTLRKHLINHVGNATVLAFTGNQAPRIRADIYRYFETIDK